MAGATRSDRARAEATGANTDPPPQGTNTRSRARARAPDAERQPERGDQEASSHHPSRQEEPAGNGAPHVSHHDSLFSHRGADPTPSTALRMAQELLCYRPSEAGKEEWLLRIEELINTAGTADRKSVV